MNNFKTFELKNNLLIDFCILSKNDVDNEFFVVALDGKKQVGYCNFSFKNNECKINRIAISEKDYLSKGIGNVMFKAMENFAYQNGIQYISGIFTPRGYNDAHNLTAKFYQRQQMKSLDNDYDYCDRDDLLKKINSALPEYDLPKIIDEKLYDKVQKYNYNTNDLFSTSDKNNEPLEL